MKSRFHHFHAPVTFTQLWQITRAAAKGWIDDNAPSMGAALAYYTLFSMAPLLLIAVSVAGLVFGAEAARGEILVQLQGLLGVAGALAVQQLLESVNRPAGGVAATLLGVVLMLIGATTVFAELQDALDRIWRAPTRARGGWWALLRARVLSFGLILGLGFLLVVSMLSSAALAALQKGWSTGLDSWQGALSVLNLTTGFVWVTVVFAMIYKIMPRVRIHWSDVWLGAVVTATFFSIGRALIGAYLSTGAVASGFGAAASLVAVLVWVYYSAQIFLLGAEFTWAFAHTAGSRRGLPLPPMPALVPVPADGAMSYTAMSTPPTVAAERRP
jgi:membrane protein